MKILHCLSTLLLIGLYTIPALGQTPSATQTWSQSYKNYVIDVEIKRDSVYFDYNIFFAKSDSQDKAKFQTEHLDTFLYILKEDLASLPDEKDDILIFLHGMMAGRKYMHKATLDDFRDRYIDIHASSLSRMISYRWPGNVLDYNKDKANAHFIAPAMADHMAIMAAEVSRWNNERKINVMTHSLGSELFKEIVKHQVTRDNVGFQFNEVAIVAPDLDTDVFEKDRPLASLHKYCERATVYLSHKDLTLTLSTKINERGRLGLDGPTPETIFHDSLFFVDMTEVKDEEQFGFRFNGHNYVRASPLGSKDILMTLCGMPEDSIVNRQLVDKEKRLYKVSGAEER